MSWIAPASALALLLATPAAAGPSAPTAAWYCWGGTGADGRERLFFSPVFQGEPFSPRVRRRYEARFVARVRTGWSVRPVRTACRAFDTVRIGETERSVRLRLYRVNGRRPVVETPAP